MVRVDREAVQLPGGAREVGERGVGYVDDQPTPAAHEMGMTVRSEVVKGGPEPRMDVLYYLQLVQTLQEPVDRRRGHARDATFDLGDQIVGRQVLVGLAQDGDEHTCGHGQPSAGVADDPVNAFLFGLVCPGGVHPRTLPRGS